MAEETTGLGTQKIVEENIKADMAVVGEPSDEKIYRAHKGTMWFNLFTYGKLEHSSESNSESNNAIINMMKLIMEINEISKELETIENNLVGHPSINVGLINGGTKQNMIADSCRISIDRRTLPEEKTDEILDKLRIRLDRLRSLDDRLTFDLEIDTIREAVEVSESEQIVQELKKALNKVFNKDTIVSGMKATTDMSILVNQGKIPSVIYGPGFIKQAHTIDEFIEVERLIKSSEVYVGHSREPSDNISAYYDILLKIPEKEKSYYVYEAWSAGEREYSYYIENNLNKYLYIICILNNLVPKTY